MALQPMRANLRLGLFRRTAIARGHPIAYCRAIQVAMAATPENQEVGPPPGYMDPIGELEQRKTSALGGGYGKVSSITVNWPALGY